MVRKTQARAIPRFLKSSLVITSSVSQLEYSYSWLIFSEGGRKGGRLTDLVEREDQTRELALADDLLHLVEGGDVLGPP